MKKKPLPSDPGDFESSNLFRSIECLSTSKCRKLMKMAVDCCEEKMDFFFFIYPD